MRFNIFNQIHKALRTLLYDTACIIQQTDFTHAAETTETLKRIQQVIDVFEKHAHYEDTYILPAIDAWDPALASDFEQEHIEDHALAQRLTELMHAFRQAANGIERGQLGNAIQIAFTEFIGFNLKHMAREERVLNAALWKQYDDIQIIALSKTIVASVPPDELAFTSLWMIKGLNNQEIITWLQQMRSSAPEPAFRALFTLAAAELPAGRWRLIQEVLMDGVMVA